MRHSAKRLILICADHGLEEWPRRLFHERKQRAKQSLSVLYGIHGRTKSRRIRGSSYLIFFWIMVLTGVLSMALLSTTLNEYQGSALLRDRLAATNLAEAGLARALHELNYGNGEFTSVENVPLGDGAYSVQKITVNGQTLLRATGAIPADGSRVVRTITAELKKTAHGYIAVQKKY
jgi:Tfp pilus assembly protein PilX